MDLDGFGDFVDASLDSLQIDDDEFGIPEGSRVVLKLSLLRVILQEGLVPPRLHYHLCLLNYTVLHDIVTHIGVNDASVP